MIRKCAVLLGFEAIFFLVLVRSDTSQLLRVLKFGVWDGRLNCEVFDFFGFLAGLQDLEVQVPSICVNHNGVELESVD